MDEDIFGTPVIYIDESEEPLSKKVQKLISLTSSIKLFPKGEASIGQDSDILTLNDEFDMRSGDDFDNGTGMTAIESVFLIESEND